MLASSPILERVTVPVPPATRTIGESLNLFANTCSDLMDNMSILQRRIDAMEMEKEDRANQSWADLSNAAQGK